MNGEFATAETIDQCIALVKKLRRTKVVGLDRGRADVRNAWLRGRYDAFKDVEEQLADLKPPGARIVRART